MMIVTGSDGKQTIQCFDVFFSTIISYILISQLLGFRGSIGGTSFFDFFLLCAAGSPRATAVGTDLFQAGVVLSFMWCGIPVMPKHTFHLFSFGSGPPFRQLDRDMMMGCSILVHKHETCFPPPNTCLCEICFGRNNSLSTDEYVMRYNFRPITQID